jgi:hypothetical protein
MRHEQQLEAMLKETRAELDKIDEGGHERAG